MIRPPVQPPERLRLQAEADRAARKRTVRLRPIPLPDLPWGMASPVDLYQLVDQELSLLFRAGETLDPGAFGEVAARTERLYCPKDAPVDWEGLVDQNLTAILRSPLPVEAKAQLAYRSVTRTLEKTFKEEFSANRYGEAREIVTALNGLMSEPGAIESLFQLTVHDYYTYTHSVHVYLYSSMLTRTVLGEANPGLLQELGTGYILHDIGKKDIPPEVINKPGPLTEEEWEVIKAHPRNGYEHLKRVAGKISDEVAEIVLQHHERDDGRGYPAGLKGHEIGRYAKICAVADCFDALTTHRSYKKALSKMAALTVMQNTQGQFNPALLGRFIQTTVDKLE